MVNQRRQKKTIERVILTNNKHCQKSRNLNECKDGVLKRRMSDEALYRLEFFLSFLVFENDFDHIDEFFSTTKQNLLPFI